MCVWICGCGCECVLFVVVVIGVFSTENSPLPCFICPKTHQNVIENSAVLLALITVLGMSHSPFSSNNKQTTTIICTTDAMIIILDPCFFVTLKGRNTSRCVQDDNRQ